MIRKFVGILFLGLITTAYGQQSKETRPKLVVGIVVDQMRHEYLDRFNSKYGTGGFKRLMNDGFDVKNGHYNYVPTYTGPGHASVYTGSTPAIHGIIGNDWYDKTSKTMVNCVGDPRQKVVGVEKGHGTVSPWRLLTTTITDELKLATQKHSKVIGMSIKDRGASLPAGHMADGAFWFDDNIGGFITSTFYMEKLPDWVDKFNKQQLPEKYLSQTWNTYYPIEQYTESGPDNTPYESKLLGKDKSVFPYDLKELRKKAKGYGMLLSTPFSNDYLTEFAKTAIDAEKLGQGEWTDFLTVSFSTTDIVGHAMGPNAIEIEDIYIRLDKNLEDLLKYLDTKVGAGNYTVFLTADHGVSEVAQYLKDSKIPAGYFSTSNVKAKLNDYLKQYFPDKDLIEDISNDQIFFNSDIFQSNPRSAGVDFLIASELISKYLMTVDGIATVYSESVLRQGDYNEGGIKGMVMRGYNPKRSGDLAFTLEPGWYASGSVQGTTHGSLFTYDTNVPILFYGCGIPKGSTVRYHRITDIAPTLSVLLKIKYPSGCTGQPIEEIFEK